MSKIYEYLKAKALDPKYQNKRFYTVNNMYEGKKETQRYTYKEVFDEVNFFIAVYKKCIPSEIEGMPIFLTASSVVEDIISMIALMEIGLKPIIVQKDSLFVFYNTSHNNEEVDFPYIVAPVIRINNDKSYELYKNILDAYQITTHHHVVADNEKVTQLLAENIIVDDLEDDDFDFALLTSGTTGKKKVIKLKEDILIDKIKKDYELESSELYMCPNPISAISGLIFTMYLPIIGNNKSVFVCFHYDDDNVFNDSDYDYENLNLITATSYFEEQYAQNKYYPALNPIIRAKTNKITLLGSRISTRCYEYLHGAFPRVKKGDIYQYYGRTEDYGLISKVNDKDVKLVYVMQKQINFDQFYYSLDGKTVLKDECTDDEIITYETDIEFNHDDFIQISNIANLDESSNVDINGYIFGEIYANGKSTGDFGFKIGSSIYYLCRGSDLLLNVDHFTQVNWFEKVFNKQLEKIFPKENVKCYCLAENGKLNIYIPFKTEVYRNDNYDRVRRKLLPFINAINYQHTNDVILFDIQDIRQGDEIGKFKKYKFIELKTPYSVRNINGIEDINKALYEEIGKLLGKKGNIDYDQEHQLYIFPQSEFTSMDLAKIVYNFHVLEFKIYNNNYYLAIDDKFLFAKYDYDIKYQPKESLEELNELILSGEIRGHVVSTYGYVLNQVFEIGTYYNEKNQLTAVILDEFTFPDEQNIHNPKHNVSKYRSKVQNINRVVVQFSGYDYLHYSYFDDYEFSIDDDDNLYCDNKLYEFNQLSADIYGTMKRFLLIKKHNLNPKDKRFFKYLK